MPDPVGLDLAAAVMLQGMTAHFLCQDTFPLIEGQRCLIHAGAGGVGHLFIQMAKNCGATVFTTVSTEAKADLARRAGADHVINYRQVDFVEAIQELAGPKPLDVVYDGVGTATFSRGMVLLRPRGMMVTFGNASGPPLPVDSRQLMRLGSLFVTRPMLWDYVATRNELERRASDLFAWISAGALDVHIGALSCGRSCRRPSCAGEPGNDRQDPARRATRAVSGGPISCLFPPNRPGGCPTTLTPRFWRRS